MSEHQSTPSPEDDIALPSEGVISEQETSKQLREDYIANAMRWHDKAQACKMDCMRLEKENDELKEMLRRQIIDAFPTTEERVKWEELIQERDGLRLAASDNADWFDCLVKDLSDLLGCEKKPTSIIDAVNELRKDKERLDWLLHGFLISIETMDGCLFPNIRSSIDSSMKGEK